MIERIFRGYRSLALPLFSELPETFYDEVLLPPDQSSTDQPSPDQSLPRQSPPRQSPPARLDISSDSLDAAYQLFTDHNAKLAVYLSEPSQLEEALRTGDAWLQQGEKGQAAWEKHPLGELLLERRYSRSPSILPVVSESALHGLDIENIKHLETLAQPDVNNHSWINLRVVPEEVCGDQPLPLGRQAEFRGIAHILQGGETFYFDPYDRGQDFIYSSAADLLTGEVEGVVQSSIRALGMVVAFAEILKVSKPPAVSREILGRIASGKIELTDVVEGQISPTPPASRIIT